MRLRLPRSLLHYWGGAESLDVDAATLAEALTRLEERYPGLGARVLDDRGRVRAHVLVFVNRDDVRDRAPEDVGLAAGDVVHVVPAVSGG